MGKRPVIGEDPLAWIAGKETEPEKQTPKKRKATSKRKKLVEEKPASEEPAAEPEEPPEETEEKPATIRQTYHVDAVLVEKIRNIAYWDRITVTEVVNAAIRSHVARLEEERGEEYPDRRRERVGRPVTS